MVSWAWWEMGAVVPFSLWLALDFHAHNATKMVKPGLPQYPFRGSDVRNCLGSILFQQTVCWQQRSE